MRSGRLRAVVIEPNLALADSIHDMLLSLGFEVATFATHGAAAASATMIDYVDLVAAAMPASRDDIEGAFLEEARVVQGRAMALVLLLDSTYQVCGSAPPGAISLIKPFTFNQMHEAVVRATTGEDAKL
jgi:hypothetical protein